MKNKNKSIKVNMCDAYLPM